MRPGPGPVVSPKAPASNAPADPIIIEPELTIVGIGASAGGLEAMQRLLPQLAADSGLAYVLVQHLAPNHESFLVGLLRSTSAIPVVQAVEQMPVRANRLHVIPPNVQMTMTDGHLHLAPRPSDRTQYNAIDSFFESLAHSALHRAVGVVLSGSSSDGAAGLREIKLSGGVTIAQEPRTARHDTMPRAAIATGAVDLVLSPEAIATELSHLGTHPFPSEDEGNRSNEVQISEPQLGRLFYLLRTSSGVDFSDYKLPTIKRRLQRRMALHKVADIDKYLRLLDNDSVELRSLYRDILIHVTRFFRDPESFVALKTTVFPRLIDDLGSKRPIRVWVPGCATGEEAYSIAIALLEHLGDDANTVPVQVFATDVSEDAIERARQGVFPENIAADVTSERLRRYFNGVDGQYRISKQVRDCCIFARQDLTRDPPFSKLDLIVCRNVLIYLGPRLQRKLMGVFHYALKQSGYLVLGATETVGVHGELFNVVDKRHKIYAKGTGRSRVDFDFALPPGPAAETDHFRVAVPLRQPRETDLPSEVTRLLLGRYAPPGVVIDGNDVIVQTRGRTGRFLELSSGEATLNLLQLAREGLLHGLRSALRQAKKTGRPSRREGLIVTMNGTNRVTDVQVVPFEVNEAAHYLVLFEETARRRDSAAHPTRRNKRGKTRHDVRIDQLQDELTSSREYMQAIIQELEAANEELQSANEEILSSNEELQSTNEELDTAKEELQSTNEELNTVNEELNGRNEELSLLNADLVNLLAAVPAAVVIVNSDLRIRRFTPPAEQLLNLIPSDVGRPLGDLKPNIDAVNLDVLAREVVNNIRSKEIDVRDRTGRAYVLRIRPYKDQANRIDGAVLSFMDAARRPIE